MKGKTESLYRDEGVSRRASKLLAGRALPAGWETAPLKRVCRLNPESLSENTDPALEFGYVDIGSVSSTGTIVETEPTTFEKAPSRARRAVRPNDVILATVRPYLKAVALIEDKGLIASTGFAVLRAHQSLDPRFFWRYLQSDPFIELVVARSVGVSYPAISPSELGALPVLVPPKATQRAIADFLDRETDRIDDLIAQKERLLELLEEQRMAMITQAVTKGLDPDVEMKDSGVEWIRRFPAHWTVHALKHSWTRAEYGLSTSLSGTGPIPVLTMAHIQKGETTIPAGGSIHEADVPDGLFLRKGDILYNRTNSRTLVGKVGLIANTPRSKATFASYLVRLRTNKRADPLFLRYLLNTETFLGFAQSHALLSINQANLNPSRYGALPVALPPVEEQVAIAKRIQELDLSIKKLGKPLLQATRLLREHRTALISAAVTGKINVQDRSTA